MNKKENFLYSIDLLEFAILNQDGSVPSPNDWEDKHPITGKVRKHKGGIVGKSGTFDISGLSGDDLKVGVRYGTKERAFTFTSTAVDDTACTIAEMVADLNTGFEDLEADGIKLIAKVTDVGADYDSEFIKITDAEISSNKLPFYSMIGFTGKLAELLEIRGWMRTLEGKNFKADFEKETGNSTEAKSGRGVRCVVKDPDTIKGVNISVGLAGMENKLISTLTGDTYNEETDEYYHDNLNNPPSFASRYFVKAFEEGTNTKSSNTRVRVFVFPSCQLTPSGTEAGEDSIATTELSGSGGENKRSNLAMKFHKGIPVAEYKKFVEVI